MEQIYFSFFFSRTGPRNSIRRPNLFENSCLNFLFAVKVISYDK
jgi:hypothetical protein